MAGSCCFVQFPHPGAEHGPGPSRGRAWNTLTAAHARKFMQPTGEWIDADSNTASGDLWAWGEWEPQSRLLRRLDGFVARGYPQCLWRPYHVIPEDGYRGLHNTDPFIFGERFLMVFSAERMIVNVVIRDPRGFDVIASRILDWYRGNVPDEKINSDIPRAALDRIDPSPCPKIPT